MSDTVEKETEFDGDIFDSMVAGSFEPEEQEPEVESENEDDNTLDEIVDDNEEDQEDTDQEDDLEDEEELDEDGDGDLDEDLEDDGEDEEEDSLVEDNDLDDEDEVTEDTEEEADEADDEGVDEEIIEESEDDAETEEPSDGEAPATDEVDYKAFYDSVVNTEFVVNGRKTKGFADPKKIIQAQQMAGGFSEKMAGFKQYRPFMAPLKDRGMLDNQAKFDLAMNLIDGDKEAIKAHLQSLDIDPLELDMDTIEYDGKSNVASTEALIIEDVMDRARASGVEDKVRQVIGKDWDAESFQEFTTNENVRNDLLKHIETGAYERVQDKISELSRTDYNGAYSNMTTINKYRAAVRELAAEEAARPPVQPKAVTASPKKVVKKATVKSEKTKIAQARKEEEYKEKVSKREAKITQQRKRAASMSKKRAKPKAKPVAFDPATVEGDDLDTLMEQLISGGRG